MDPYKRNPYVSIDVKFAVMTSLIMIGSITVLVLRKRIG